MDEMSRLKNKEIMAKNIQRLMILHGKDRNDVCKDLNLKYTTFTDWIKGNAYPRIDKIDLLADYFGVSKTHLIEEVLDVTDPWLIGYDDFPQDQVMHLGNNIRYLRTLKGYSQEYIAKQLGYKSFTTIQKWESGISEPPIKKLEELALLFNVSLDDMYNKQLTLANTPPTEETNHMDTINIGSNIKNIRESKGLKQHELAELVGVSDKTVSSWEVNRTEPKLDKIEEICKVLCCTKTDLIGDNEFCVSSYTNKDIKNNLETIIEQLTNHTDNPVFYEGEELSLEAAELFCDELIITTKRLNLINTVIKMSFIDKLELLMQENNITSKAELSRISEIPYTTIDGLYKKGTDNIKLSTLKKLSKCLNCTLDCFVDSDDSQPNSISFNETEYTTQELEEIRKFAAFIKSQREQ